VICEQIREFIKFIEFYDFKFLKFLKNSTLYILLYTKIYIYI